MAGERGARVEIRGASSLGPRQALERSPTWDARGRRRELAGGGLSCAVMGHMLRIPSGGAWRAGAHCTVGKGSRDRSPPEPAISAAIGGSRPGEAAPAQEQAGCHPGRLESADRHLRDRSARRCRDLAILLLAFASGGTRRSEVARLRVEQLRDEPPARVDPHDPKSPALPGLAIQLGRTKTADADEEGRVLLVDPPVGRFTNGWSGPTSRRGRSSGRSTAGKRWKRTPSRRS